MEKVQIKFANQNIELVCSDGQQVTQLASKINQRIDLIKKNSPNYSFLQLSFFTALMLQKEVEDLESNLRDSNVNKQNVSHRNNQELCYKYEKEIYELHEIINDLIRFIENLTSKLDDM